MWQVLNSIENGSSTILSVTPDENTVAVYVSNSLVSIYKKNIGSGFYEKRGNDINVGNQGAFVGSVILSDDGNTVLVGRRNNFNDGFFVGAFRVYDYNAGTNVWDLYGSEIVGENRGGSNFFGNSVDISSDGTIFAVQGTQYYSRVYKKEAGALVQVGNDIDISSTLVKMSSDGQILIFSDVNIGGGLGGFKPYKFNPSNNLWENFGGGETGQITVGTVETDFFGVGLDCSSDGKTVVISTQDDTSGTGYALVYRYNQTTSTWEVLGSPPQQLRNLNGTFYDSENFGQFVSISPDGTKIVVGSEYMSQDGGTTQQGGYVLYELDTSVNPNVYNQIDVKYGTASGIIYVPTVFNSGKVYYNSWNPLNGSLNVFIGTFVICFNEGTKILAFDENIGEESYIPIENLKENMLVRTKGSAKYRPVHKIYSMQIMNMPKYYRNCIYSLESGEEELLVTGSHGIVVDNFTENVKPGIKKENCKYLGEGEKYLVPVAALKKAKKIEEGKVFTIYNFCLGDIGKDDFEFVWANGILTEVMTVNYFESMMQYV